MEENNHSKKPGDEGAFTAERARALQQIINELLPFSNEDRRALIETLITFYGLSIQKDEQFRNLGSSVSALPNRNSEFKFSELSNAPSPKAFMLDKSPMTDVERVACLGFYLANFRGTPHFKTKDISALNTESAHKKFSNAAMAVDNATKAGYLVPSIKGSKQLSATGERFVEALPDRDAAREAFDKAKQRRNGGVGKKRSKD